VNTSNDVALGQLRTQQALTVETLRRVLQGDWDAARVYLDAIDPSHAGAWHNVPFPKEVAPE
jgi:hypothetical protein